MVPISFKTLLRMYRRLTVPSLIPYCPGHAEGVEISPNFDRFWRQGNSGSVKFVEPETP